MRAIAILLFAASLAGCVTPPSGQPSGPVSRPDWVRADLDARWLDGKGGVAWPPENGFAGPASPIILPPGVLLDRFGPESGRFLSPKGAAFGARALPTACAVQPYAVYRVTAPLPVWIGRAAPWFDAPGGATQVQTDAPVAVLVADGILARQPEQKADCR